MTQTNEPRTPALAARTNWFAWIALWTLGAGVVFALLANNAGMDTRFWLATRWAVGDGDYYRWADFHAAHAAAPGAAPGALATRPFYLDASPPLGSRFYHDTAWLWKALKGLGTVWAALIVVAVIAFLGRPRWYAGVGAACAIGLGNLPAATCFVFGRDRPTHHDGQNHWVFFRGFHDTHDLSFPSGHATAAFALAAVLAFHCRKTRWFAVPLAAACAFSRIVMEAHFYSDIVAGGVLGWTAGWFAARGMQAIVQRLSASAANV